MARTARMFEIVQMLRAARKPLTAQGIAQRLGVTPRTVYRDIAALQAAGIPAEGEAGIGYVLRGSLDLPPMRFTADELEAILVGLSMIGRTGDRTLVAAGENVLAKIADILPCGSPPLDPSRAVVSGWHDIPPGATEARLLREAIRADRKVLLHYRDAAGNTTRRIVCPIAMIYYVDSLLLAAYCELRGGFRHFRHDRIEYCEMLDTSFASEARQLRQRWRDENSDKLACFGIERPRGK